VDEVITDVDACIDAALAWQQKGEAHSIAYLGNVVDLWERLAARNIHVDLGSDQTSLHNPWAGGYYPVGLSYEESNALMVQDPAAFKQRVQDTLRRHVTAVNTLTAQGMYFFDYGNAFLLESKRDGCGDRLEPLEGRRVPVPELRGGHHGSPVLRPWLRSVPLGVHERRSEGPGHQRPHRR
jgi:urocanate hydratase